MDDLVTLCEQMAHITNPVCGNECTKYRDKKYRCCERKYCEIAREYAKSKYNIELQETGNPELPFMGETGCTVAPHLRPICTLHACPISYAPTSNLGNDPERTSEYFKLYYKILAEAKATEKEITWPL